MQLNYKWLKKFYVKLVKQPAENEAPNAISK